MNYQAMTDEELLTKYYADDDLKAFQVFAERWWPILVSCGRSRLRGLGGEQDAEDIANTTLFKVALTKQKPSSRWNPQKGIVGPWVWKIFNNELATKKRDLLRRVPDVLLIPQGDMISEELLGELKECIKRLPDKQQSVVNGVLAGQKKERYCR